jgi:predicted Zn-dependent protease
VRWHAHFLYGVRVAPLILLLGSLLLLGCGTGSTSSASNRWLAEHGGTLPARSNPRQVRADAALARLVRAQPEMHATVKVLASETIGAYSWPNGQIFVTAGLIDHVTQDELEAALAHELGHLIGDGHVRVVASLRGCDQDRDAEARADAVGVQVLQLQGLQAESMIALLEKVRASTSLSQQCQHAIDGRIQLLHQGVLPR